MAAPDRQHAAGDRSSRRVLLPAVQQLVGHKSFHRGGSGAGDKHKHKDEAKDKDQARAEGDLVGTAVPQHPASMDYRKRDFVAGANGYLVVDDMADSTMDSLSDVVAVRRADRLLAEVAIECAQEPGEAAV